MHEPHMCHVHSLLELAAAYAAELDLRVGLGFSALGAILGCL